MTEAAGESPTLSLARALIQKQSVTPDDAGCQQLIAKRLETAGFTIEQLRCGAVDNLWAVHGESGPLLCLLGHTDVVPAGPEAEWQRPAFAAELADGMLHGRGSADMKGSVAAMVTACERFTARFPEHRGRLAVLLTSDEEGPAVDGTRHVVEVLNARNQHIDWCLIGEPSCAEHFGDTIKYGRRGSLNGQLQLRGIQGHIAYPQQADNPIIRFAPALNALLAECWDRGNEAFPPTSLQFSALSADSGADNVIPGQLFARFNFRFSTAVNVEELQRRTAAILDAFELDYQLSWSVSGLPFLSTPNKLIPALQAAVAECTGVEPRLATDGGTSDGRHVAPTGAETAEFGPLNATIHKIDEAVNIEELNTLSKIYEIVLQRMLS